MLCSCVTWPNDDTGADVGRPVMPPGAKAFSPKAPVGACPLAKLDRKSWLAWFAAAKLLLGSDGEDRVAPGPNRAPTANVFVNGELLRKLSTTVAGKESVK